MRIAIHRFRQAGQNGDRARTLTPYFSYKVGIRDEDNFSKEEFWLREWEGYDSFNCSIEPDQWRNVEVFANQLADHFGWQIDPVRTFAVKRQVIETWEEEEL